MCADADVRVCRRPDEIPRCSLQVLGNYTVRVAAPICKDLSGVALQVVYPVAAAFGGERAVDRYAVPPEIARRFGMTCDYEDGRRCLVATEDGKGIDPENVRAELKRGGKLSREELLRCKVRYFTDGFVLGTKAFVEEFFERNREAFSRKRKSGARKMRGGDWRGLKTMRDLRRWF